jgi:hypothetical protein
MTEPMLNLPFTTLDKDTLFKFAKQVLQDEYPIALTIKVKNAAFPCLQGDYVRLSMGSGHCDYKVGEIKQLTSCAVNPLLEVELWRK